MSLDVYLTRPAIEAEEVFSANITHNLNKMAEEAGIYYHLWRPAEIGAERAWQLIDPLTKAIELMESDPSRFIKFNADNGWGTYEDFLPWVKEYLKACVDNPGATISVSR